MGKTKKEKNNRRTNPTGLQSVEEAEKQTEKGNQPEKEQYPVLQQVSYLNFFLNLDIL